MLLNGVELRLGGECCADLSAGGLNSAAVGGEDERIVGLAVDLALLDGQSVADGADDERLGADVDVFGAVGLGNGLDVDELSETLDGGVALVEELAVLAADALAGGDLLIEAGNLLSQLGCVAGERRELGADGGLHGIELGAEAVELLRK